MGLIEDTVDSVEPLKPEWFYRASLHLDSLAKPKGSLGKLEEFAKRVVAITESERPNLDRKAVFVLAGDHGVTQENVSAYSREITYLMVYNFLRGGAAINVLARHVGVDVFVVDMGVDWVFDETPGLIVRKINRGTKNFVRQPAMTFDEAKRCIETGIELALDKIREGYNFIALGDMGIGNTTSSAAVMCACTGLNPKDVVGYGTGVDYETWKRKVRVVKTALSIHNPDPSSPVDVLSKVGGFEIGGIAGIILGAASKRVPVVVDGFVSTAGALIALGLCRAVGEYMFFAHRSAERGHGNVLSKLGFTPILDLDMRLGEGTGAVLAMSLIEAGVKIYNEMITLKEVSTLSL